jgi:DNA-binding transcriptional regulator YiaG
MKLEQFRQDKKLSYGQLASRLGATHATIVRRWCLPKSHKQRMIPSEKYMDAIIKYTQSAVMPNDFYSE